jgi:hypothetical protein
MASEQRTPTIVVAEQQPRPLTGDALRAEIDRLTALYQAEQAAAAAAQAEQAPPPPWETSLVTLLEIILRLLGYPAAAESAYQQLKRALQK